MQIWSTVCLIWLLLPQLIVVGKSTWEEDRHLLSPLLFEVWYPSVLMWHLCNDCWQGLEVQSFLVWNHFYPPKIVFCNTTKWKGEDSSRPGIHGWVLCYLALRYVQNLSHEFPLISVVVRILGILDSYLSVYFIKMRINEQQVNIL